MGRRSINTTKSGKYMNPTDQARKEARKRELKKNKKQRIAVRHAVLKSKDPLQLLEEASMYDKQEYDPNVQSSLNERVLQGKRKRLLETFDNLVTLYKKEDPEYAKDLLRARKDYDKRRHDMMLYYEQVKLAERTKASDIPLPDLPPSQLGLPPSEIPMPMGISMSFTKGILKKPLCIPGPPPGAVPIGRKPPGPPSLPIPDLTDSESEDTDIRPDPTKQRRIRFVEVDLPFMCSFILTIDEIFNDVQASGFLPGLPTSQIPLPPVGAGVPGFPGVVAPGYASATASGAVLSAPPAMNPLPLHHLESVAGDAGVGGSSGTTIEAKPQLKNLIGDATRFVPTSLKVRRTVKDARGRLIQVGGGINSTGIRLGSSLSASQRLGSVPGGSLGVPVSTVSSKANATNKDAAYEEFMREMEGLL
ncbi:WW domain-binding protein [Echinococcus granulosus]|uniref:WW domain-binding protein n=1 Tax=Echinococcus granulosus TaxID=6210 RepID=W6UTR0_ECHGR|nr:WW domain-binding protein [Echinococcus granulosus]EUB64036.1 WW domain-binding protein [Echinococcus granulosus]